MVMCAGEYVFYQKNVRYRGYEKRLENEQT